jgi:hypothetical protein
MGAQTIGDDDLQSIGVEVREKKIDGDRALTIPEGALQIYIKLIKEKLRPGFWNEIVGATAIHFIFKLIDGSIREFDLSPQNEKEVNDLCLTFNNEPPDLTPNVYKYISDNAFYHDFMVTHYSALIDRKH